jgi:hypothetical protein
MRYFGAVCLVACVALTLTSFQAKGSEGFDDVAKLAKSGVTEDVLVAFIQASPVPYDLTVDEILYLSDLGVTPKAISEIVAHGKDIRAGKEPAAPVADTAVQPMDTTPPVATAADLTPVNLPTNDANADPNAPPQYVNNFAGDVSSTPEVVQEKEIVRDTVYTPTVVTAPPEGGATLSTFYETLTPYGTWININGTWCWQPSVGSLNVSWRPYCHRGHWVWTDCGWCWQSDYSWGWAPFHYGRWCQVEGYGWLWEPDTVWAPSWVSWRECDSHWGWAPLPFAARFDVGAGFHFGGQHWGVDIGFGLGASAFCFVPRDHFYDLNCSLYLAPRDQINVFYGRTTIIQNNVVFENNRMIVRGPSIENVRAVSKREVRELRLADNNIAGGAAISGASREERDRGELRIYRPKVSNVAVESPHAVAARQLAAATVLQRPSADPRVLAASARADELRERHFATQDARRQEVVTRQSARLEEASARQSDYNQLRLNKAIANEGNAERKAQLAGQLAEERKGANDARLRKVELDKQAGEQRRLADEAAHQQIKVARATANADSARQAQQAKAQLAAERATREQSQREAALQSEKVAAEHNAKAVVTQPGVKVDAETARAQTEAASKARLEAARAANESRRASAEAARTKQPAQPSKGNEQINPKTGRPYGQ